MSENLNLTVSISADAWAYAQRRLVYLETLLLHIVRDRVSFQEWFSAADLANKALPGLPPTKEAITRKATSEGWMKRKARVNGRWTNAYHVASLPARTFDALISRILDLPEIDAVVKIMPDLPDIPTPEARQEENTAPPWVLPLMRIMRTETGGDMGEAWNKLPDRLPPGISLPSVEEAAKVLIRLGLARG